MKTDGSKIMQADSADMALSGDTRMPLHYKPLPRRGPVISVGDVAGPSSGFETENSAGPSFSAPKPDRGISRYAEGKGTGSGGEEKGY